MKIRNRRTLIISGFPAIGKSFLFNNEKYKDLSILDSDSSQYSWIKDEKGENTKERNQDFPNNYIQHIKDNIGYVDIILVSSHKVVRDALKENNINYVLVYPYKVGKEDFINRYISRGNDSNFINFIKDNWDNFIEEMDSENFPKKLRISSDKYLSDYIDKMLKYCPYINNYCDVLYTNADEYEGNPCCRCNI